jgi:exodeoxyribonuclease VII small subunit
MEEKMTYEKAVKRLEEIVKQIEGGEMDIDSLTANLKEAKALVGYCKEKLTNVEAEVKKCLDL